MAEYKSLYRKWRPTTFSDVYGQEHITKVLTNQVLNKKVSHAYLFCGSRGTGKTTCAKILAKSVNCENPIDGNPCNICASCAGIESGRVIDVIEIDAASNNGVENIREIREDAAFTPGESFKKVYIIDEVHMLSIGAFNALLKTLEEPPPHIIFILATTEINKIPATILSRCQRHDFRRIVPDVIAERLKVVCEGENISIEDKAIDLIARLSGGAIRDALSILEVCIGDAETKHITYDYVSQVSGYFDVEKMVLLCGCIKDSDAEQALRIFWDMYDNSLDCANFCMSLLEMFRHIQIAKIIKEPHKYINLDKSETDSIIKTAESFDNADLARCYNLISDVCVNINRYTTNKRVTVEMLIVEMCMKNTIMTPVIAPNITAITPSQTAIPMQTEPSKQTDGKAGYFNKYADLIEEISKENKMITPYLKSGNCIIDEQIKKVTIYMDSEFKVNLLREPNNTAVIQKHLSKFVSGEYMVAIEMQKQESRETAHKNSIDDIINSAK